MLFDWSTEITLAAAAAAPAALAEPPVAMAVIAPELVALAEADCEISAKFDCEKLPPTLNCPPATASSSLTVSSRIVSSFGFRASPDEHQLKVNDQGWDTRLLKYG
jgi:hypothetical protein